MSPSQRPNSEKRQPPASSEANALWRVTVRRRWLVTNRPDLSRQLLRVNKFGQLAGALQLAGSPLPVTRVVLPHRLLDGRRLIGEAERLLCLLAERLGQGGSVL